MSSSWLCRLAGDKALPNAVEFTIAALAVWRLARMLASETGPFALFRNWRLFIGRKFPPQGAYVHWIDEGFSCPVCLSFYIGLACAAWLFPGYWPVTGLALGAVATILTRKVG
jgi:hypothetical protein